MRRFKLAPAVLALAILAALCDSSVQATTIVPLSDADLTISVRAIVEGRVLEVESVWDPVRGAVYTYVSVDVERTYKGTLTPGIVVLRQLGGEAGEHVTKVFGAPRFEAGRRVMLFLNADLDGALHVAHLSLGEFTVDTDPATGKELVVRADTGDALVLPSREEVTTVANREAFVRSIAETLANRASDVAHFDAEYLGAPLRIAPPEYSASRLKRDGRTSFRFLGTGFRWFEFDDDIAVPVKVNPSASPTADGSYADVKAALDAWNQVTGSSVRLKFSGKTRTAGLVADDVNSVAFGDPRDEIDDPVNCSGVVAQSGITKAIAESITINDKTFQRIVESDMVFNNGFECLLGDVLAFRETLTHEMGHVLGLAHSSENLGETDPDLRDATMYFAIHKDGRGASLRSDDAAGLRFVYPDDRSSTLEVRTSFLPDAVLGTGFDFALEAKGGASPYSWSITNGALPAGLLLSQEGLVTGTPTSDESTSFTVLVRDNTGTEVERAFAIRVTSDPAPYVSKSVYKATNEKLVVTGRHFDSNAMVTINGSTVTIAARPGHPVGADVRIVVKGSKSALRIKARGENVLTLTVDGKVSNELSF